MALMAWLAVNAQAQGHWTYDPHAFPNTMTVIGVVHINGVEIPRETMELGAFCGTQCRGCQPLEYCAPVGRYLVFLSISAQGGDVLQLRLYDAETDVELQATAPALTFDANAMLGTVGNPYVFDFSTTVDKVSIAAEVHGVDATGAVGSVEGTGLYLYGEECTLTATPALGCAFQDWTEEDGDGETVVVSTDPVYSFVVTGQRSLVANFTGGAPVDMTDLVVELYPGWNWFSCNLEIDDDLESAIKDAIAAENTSALIKDMIHDISLEDGAWSSGGLDFTNESMYMILVQDTVSLTMTSTLADPAAHPITLYPGWNWIGFLSPLPMAVEEALSSFTPNEGDLVKGSAFNATYSVQNGWNGSLTVLSPGAGYMYLNSGTTNLILEYPGLSSPIFIPTSRGEVDFFEMDPTREDN